MNEPDFLLKPIDKMTDTEWESLCDECGLCCQIRLEDWTTGKMKFTTAACKFLCLKTHKCSDYANRQKNVSDCIKITPENVYKLRWLPDTCAYRLVAFEQALPEWHYLICGDKNRVHEVGASMLGKTISEDDI